MIHEEYYKMVKGMHGPATIYINPDKNDLKELYKEISEDNVLKKVYCRFLIYENKLYVWNENFLHSSLIKSLGLPLNAINTVKINIKDAFLGVSRLIQGESKLKFDNTNQKINKSQLSELYEIYKEIFEKYFTNIEKVGVFTW